jgi:hypothetical protein
MKAATRGLCAALSVTVASGACVAQNNPFSENDDISKYLTDITGGAVSAASIVGMDKSGITQIQTAQDFVAAIQPFRSDDQKAGAGLAITPRRTRLWPVSVQDYYESAPQRIVSNLTLSYAQVDKDIENKTYRHYAYSIDTYYYLDREKDPTILGMKRAKACGDRMAGENNKKVSDLNQEYLKLPQPLTPEQRMSLADRTQKLTEEQGTIYRKCRDELAEAQKPAWNSSRVSASFGGGRLRREDGASKLSLGKSLTVNAMLGVGPDGAVNVSLRRTRDAVDVTTLASERPAHRTSKLAAIRYTYQGDASIRALVELSNSKSSTADAYKDAFMYAAGLDKKLAKGVWLEFRFGRNRSIDSGKEQSTGLLKVNIQPSVAWLAP